LIQKAKAMKAQGEDVGPGFGAGRAEPDFFRYAAQHIKDALPGAGRGFPK